MKRTFKLSSNSNFQIIDITRDVVNILAGISKETDFNDGLVNIFTKHSTSAIVINENEKGLLNDFEKVLKDIVKENDNYHHDFIDNNAASHIRSFLLGSSETVPIAGGRLDLGTWQSIFFIELDGPRQNRTVDLTFIVD